MFIRTASQKCQPFPTHSTPLSANQDTNIIAINLIGSWPLAGHNNTKVNAIAILCCSPIHVIKHPETSGMLMVFSIFCLWRERVDISAPIQKLTGEFVGVFLFVFYVVHGNFLPCNFFGHCTSNGPFQNGNPKNLWALYLINPWWNRIRIDKVVL